MHDGVDSAGPCEACANASGAIPFPHIFHFTLPGLGVGLGGDPPTSIFTVLLVTLGISVILKSDDAGSSGNIYAGGYPICARH
jgi:hypothetical protein